MKWDILICSATVFDGTGAQGSIEDVAIADGVIAARGQGLDKEDAARVIDGEGLWLMPGLLDIHTHYDLEVELDPRLPESVRHGTTTVVMSNCSLGLTFGAQRTGTQDPIVDCFARVENMPKHILQRAAERAEAWSDSAGYLEHLDTLPLGPNVVPLVPHSMLRIEAMGLQDSVTRDPSPKELARMEELLDTALEQGYAGFSTDALPFHYLANDPNRRVKIPTQFGTLAEIKRLVDRVREHDAVWQATPPKDSPLDTLRTFSLTSGRLHGKPVRLTAVAAMDVVTNKSLGLMGRVLARLLNSKAVDGRFKLQTLSAPFKVWSEGPVTPLAEEIPELRRLNEPDLEDRDARARIIRDPEFRRAFKAMWWSGKRGSNTARLKRLLGIENHTLTRDLKDMIIERAPVNNWAGEPMSHIHKRFTENAPATPEEATAFAELTTPIEDQADFFLALLERFDTDLYWWTYAANTDPDRLADLVLDPWLIPGFSDSGAHIVNMAFYDVNLRALQIAKTRGLDAVAFTVRRLTREPAEFFGLDTGTLEIGAQADVTLVDPRALETYNSEENVTSQWREVFEHDQLVNRAPGVVPLVLIRGAIVWENEAYGETLGEVALGRALRNRRAVANQRGH